MQEYEKRLLSKDQEVKAAQLAVRRLEAELHDVRAEAREAAAAAAHMLPAPEPKQGAPAAGFLTRRSGESRVKGVITQRFSCAC